MPKFNRKGLRIAFLMAVMFMLLINIAYARTIAEVFGNALAEMGNFFELGQYEPYSNAIDFFLFSILFVSLYMSGARNVFKEFKRPEKIIVVLLGLVTAFLLVLAGFSITLLLPYVHWILFLLLFLLLLWLLKGVEGKFWRFALALALALLPLALLQGYCDINWLLYLIIFLVLLFLLKGIKNRFGRFILALIITAIIFLLLQFICGYFGLSQIRVFGESAAAKGEGATVGFGNYVGGLWENIKSIRFNYRPGIPDWLRGRPTGPSVQDNRLEVIHPPAPTGAPPAQAPIKESVLGRIFGVSPQQFSTQGDYNQAIIDAGQLPRRIDQNTYYIEEEDGNPVLKRQEWGFFGIDRLNPDSVIDESNYNNILEEKEKTQRDIELEAPPVAPPTPTPTPPIPPKGGIFGTGISWAWLLSLLAVLLLFKRPRNYIKKGAMSAFETAKKRMPSFRKEGIESRIDEIISKSTEATRKIDDASFKRSKILRSADKASIYLDALTKEGRDPAMLFTEEGRETLLKEHTEIEDLLHQEFKFIDGLKELKDTELELLRLLRGGRNG